MLIKLLLKVAREQGQLWPGNKVMIFTVEDEGKPNESVNFKIIEIEGVWFLCIVLSVFDSYTSEQIRVSIVVSIPACHAGDPGSIPGRGAFFFYLN